MKQRIKTAIILLLITVPILFIKGIIQDLYFLLFLFLGTYEVIKLFDKWSKNTKLIFLLISLLIYIFNFFIPQYSTIIITSYLLLAMILPVFIENLYFNDVSFLFLMTICLNFTQLGYISLNTIDKNAFICVLLITCCTDAGAYIFGSLLGKHKLCPKISPKKTIEGFIAGIIVGTIIGLVSFKLLTSINIVLSLPISLAISLIGQLGDLVFSAIKRHYGIKDFSNLLPGHGGVLDRMDSTIISLICIYLIMLTI